MPKAVTRWLDEAQRRRIPRVVVRSCALAYGPRADNAIPLPEDSIRTIVDALEPFEFDTIHGAWWGTLVRADGSGVVKRSAERYLRALRGEFP